ncbi:hypothetical protein QFC19_001710 [Naganishia cerealis]|uniref:Uncharacterized protein n=1 Tax=Naganishia cerealis TaxID=610337 RepID=A0ACC2WGX8_9TREE|nr:hypothetical protein QFC19_001710 [Naganishia cerealis]
MNGQVAPTEERLANPMRERQPEMTILPLMEMVDGNESRQILESRVRLAEQITGTYITPSEPYHDNVVTPAASTTFTNNPSSSETHHADRRARLQSLPSTVLNPLGLLAEASLRGSAEPSSEIPSPRHSPPLTNNNPLAGNQEFSTPGGKYNQLRNHRHLPGVGNAKYFEPGNSSLTDIHQFEYSRTWLSTGIAIRMATDLNFFRRKKVQTDDPEDAHFARQGMFFCEIASVPQLMPFTLGGTARNKKQGEVLAMVLCA